MSGATPPPSDDEVQVPPEPEVPSPSISESLLTCRSVWEDVAVAYGVSSAGSPFMNPTHRYLGEDSSSEHVYDKLLCAFDPLQSISPTAPSESESFYLQDNQDLLETQLLQATDQSNVTSSEESPSDDVETSNENISYPNTDTNRIDAEQSLHHVLDDLPSDESSRNSSDIGRKNTNSTTMQSEDKSQKVLNALSSSTDGDSTDDETAPNEITWSDNTNTISIESDEVSLPTPDPLSNSETKSANIDECSNDSTWSQNVNAIQIDTESSEHTDPPLNLQTSSEAEVISLEESKCGDIDDSNDTTNQNTNEVLPFDKEDSQLEHTIMENIIKLTDEEDIPEISNDSQSGANKQMILPRNSAPRLHGPSQVNLLPSLNIAGSITTLNSIFQLAEGCTEFMVPVGNLSPEACLHSINLPTYGRQDFLTDINFENLTANPLPLCSQMVGFTLEEIDDVQATVMTSNDDVHHSTCIGLPLPPSDNITRSRLQTVNIQSPITRMNNILDNEIQPDIITDTLTTITIQTEIPLQQNNQPLIEESEKVIQVAKSFMNQFRDSIIHELNSAQDLEKCIHAAESFISQLEDPSTCGLPTVGKEITQNFRNIANDSFIHAPQQVVGASIPTTMGNADGLLQHSFVDFATDVDLISSFRNAVNDVNPQSIIFPTTNKDQCTDFTKSYRMTLENPVRDEINSCNQYLSQETDTPLIAQNTDPINKEIMMSTTQHEECSLYKKKPYKTPLILSVTDESDSSTDDSDVIDVTTDSIDNSQDSEVKQIDFSNRTLDATIPTRGLHETTLDKDTYLHSSPSENATEIVRALISKLEESVVQQIVTNTATAANNTDIISSFRNQIKDTTIHDKDLRAATPDKETEVTKSFRHSLVDGIGQDTVCNQIVPSVCTELKNQPPEMPSFQSYNETQIEISMKTDQNESAGNELNLNATYDRNDVTISVRIESDGCTNQEMESRTDTPRTITSASSNEDVVNQDIPPLSLDIIRIRQSQSDTNTAMEPGKCDLGENISDKMEFSGSGNTLKQRSFSENNTTASQLEVPPVVSCSETIPDATLHRRTQSCDQSVLPSCSRTVDLPVADTIPDPPIAVRVISHNSLTLMEGPSNHEYDFPRVSNSDHCTVPAPFNSNSLPETRLGGVNVEDLNSFHSMDNPETSRNHTDELLQFSNELKLWAEENLTDVCPDATKSGTSLADALDMDAQDLDLIFNIPDSEQRSIKASKELSVRKSSSNKVSEPEMDYSLKVNDDSGLVLTIPTDPTSSTNTDKIVAKSDPRLSQDSGIALHSLDDSFSSNLNVVQVTNAPTTLNKCKEHNENPLTNKDGDKTIMCVQIDGKWPFINSKREEYFSKSVKQDEVPALQVEVQEQVVKSNPDTPVDVKYSINDPENEDPNSFQSSSGSESEKKEVKIIPMKGKRKKKTRNIDSVNETYDTLCLPDINDKNISQPMLEDTPEQSNSKKCEDLKKRRSNPQFDICQLDMASIIGLELTPSNTTLTDVTVEDLDYYNNAIAQLRSSGISSGFITEETEDDNRVKPEEICYKSPSDSYDSELSSNIANQNHYNGENIDSQENAVMVVTQDVDAETLKSSSSDMTQLDADLLDFGAVMIIHSNDNMSTHFMSTQNNLIEDTALDELSGSETDSSSKGVHIPDEKMVKFNSQVIIDEYPLDYSKDYKLRVCENTKGEQHTENASINTNVRPDIYHGAFTKEQQVVDSRDYDLCPGTLTNTVQSNLQVERDTSTLMQENVDLRIDSYGLMEKIDDLISKQEITFDSATVISNEVEALLPIEGRDIRVGELNYQQRTSIMSKQMDVKDKLNVSVSRDSVSWNSDSRSSSDDDSASSMIESNKFISKRHVTMDLGNITCKPIGYNNGAAYNKPKSQQAMIFGSLNSTASMNTADKDKKSKRVSYKKERGTMFSKKSHVGTRDLVDTSNLARINVKPVFVYRETIDGRVEETKPVNLKSQTRSDDRRSGPGMHSALRKNTAGTVNASGSKGIRKHVDSTLRWSSKTMTDREIPACSTTSTEEDNVSDSDDMNPDRDLGSFSKENSQDEEHEEDDSASGSQQKKNNNGNVSENPSAICRICHCGSRSVPGLGPLIAACNCKGTVALVHMQCLERWLTESGANTCELCGFTFKTERVPRHSAFRSVLLWLSTSVDAKQLVLDLVWFALMTPLAVMAAYLVMLASRVLLDSNVQDAPFVMVALLLSCCVTLVAYYGWLAGAVSHHTHDWYQWYRTNYNVHVMSDNPQSEDGPSNPELGPTTSRERVLNVHTDME